MNAIKNDYFLEIVKKTLILAPVQFISWMIIQWVILEKIFEYETSYDLLLYRSLSIYGIAFLLFYVYVGFFEEMRRLKKRDLENIFFHSRFLFPFSIVIFISSFFIFVRGGSQTLGLFIFYFFSPLFLFMLVGSYLATFMLLYLGIFSGRFLAKMVK